MRLAVGLGEQICGETSTWRQSPENRSRHSNRQVCFIFLHCSSLLDVFLMVVNLNCGGLGAIMSTYRTQDSNYHLTFGVKVVKTILAKVNFYLTYFWSSNSSNCAHIFLSRLFRCSL